jgi:AraC family transcriptional regulator of adaptative response/methylated-DNA-[protein]-cysteine methyltransferase
MPDSSSSGESALEKETLTQQGKEMPAFGEEALGEAQAWAIVAARDRRFDGDFVYAVTTTGIYCRPSCPARRPHREHVRYFATPQEAEAAGYRACRRCRPASPAGTSGEQAVEQARAYVDAHLDEVITLEQLAAVVGLSPSHLQRTFKRLVGISPKEYQDARRLEAYKETVREGGNVLDATFEAGFGSSQALYNHAASGLGMTPATYRRGGDGLQIRYTTLASAFGRLLVAVTEQGVCAVSLGEEDKALVTSLEVEFPQASTITRDDEALRPWAEPIVAYLDGVHAHPTVPVDLQGTDFQRRVWKVLQEIPYGETRTYGEIAAAIGQPSAARAVAQACAANRVALVVPCHRVVRQDGAPGGYRWGPQRKQALLAQEQAAP